MGKKNKSRALRQSDTRRAQLESQLRSMRDDLRVADEGTRELSMLCTATITHCLVQAGIMDITVPEVNAAEVMDQYTMAVTRVPGNKLHITITEHIPEKGDDEP